MEEKEERLIIQPSKYAQEAIIREIYIPYSLENTVKRSKAETPAVDLELPPTASLEESENSFEDVIYQIDTRNSMYSPLDERRVISEPNNSSEYRSEFRRDYARVLHSPAFRRLQGKTQLFPCFESDFFRNRLTHSLEVAQIARTIALKLNAEYLFNDVYEQIDLDIIEFAALAHDIGHPPFGHQGEEALNECMYLYGGFEGNAQTLRLLSKLEKKRHEGFLECEGFAKNGEDLRRGLNLTYRALASVIKYDNPIPINKTGRLPTKFPKPKKGYYKTESELVNDIKKVITNGKDIGNKRFRTIECCIMDIADDIAYSTFDLEDAFKAGFINPIDIINLQSSFHESVSKRVSLELKKKVTSKHVLDIISDLMKNVLFGLNYIQGIGELNPEELKSSEYLFMGLQYAYTYSDYLKQNGYVRSDFTSQLIADAIHSIKFDRNENFLALSSIRLDEPARIRIEILKQIAFQTQILSPKLKVAEFRGKEIVKRIFDALIKDPELLPYDVRRIYKLASNKNHQHRTVCDYIACMTDKYAIELYGRITSENPATMFKPY